MIQPASTEKQDSRLKISDATAGFTFFCPSICNVYATPQDNTPAYRSGIHAAATATSLGVSSTNINGNDRIPLTKNWMQDIFTPSTFGEK